MHVYWTLPIPGLQSSSSYSSSAEGGVTIRVNTFKRIDLLEVFVDYYLGKAGDGSRRKKNCDLVKQIQVVWSDTSAQPPASWVKQYGGGTGTSTTDGDRLVFEVHPKDSLNNRFMPSTEIKTEAVLSVDDDLIIPCDVLAENLHVWRSFDKTLVGFSPRAYAYDAVTGAVKYLRWQHTWWSGVFSIMLTKASFLHRDYLRLYVLCYTAFFLPSFLPFRL
jgi:glucuronyl/N-acetylglucosaminyl transferase EXT2